MPADYSILDDVLKEMGAKKVHIPIQQDSQPPPVPEELKSGYVVNADDFKNIPTVGGLFAHKDKQGFLHHAFLYIDEPMVYEDALLQKPAIDAQRFHLINCQKLIQMYNEGRSKRYIPIQNPEGWFPTKPQDPITGKTMADKEINARLLPCKHCLEALAYKGYKNPRTILTPLKKTYNEQIFLNFDTRKFVKHNAPFFFDERYYRKQGNHISKHMNHRTSYYTFEHVAIREHLLLECNHTCMQCGVNLDDRTDLLHLHHENSQKDGNQKQNFKIFCIECHSRSSLYPHMKEYIKSTDLILIIKRREQKKRRT